MDLCFRYSPFRFNLPKILKINSISLASTVRARPFLRAALAMVPTWASSQSTKTLRKVRKVFRQRMFTSQDCESRQNQRSNMADEVFLRVSSSFLAELLLSHMAVSGHFFQPGTERFLRRVLPDLQTVYFGRLAGVLFLRGPRTGTRN